MKSNSQNIHSKLKLSKQILTRTIIATSFMVASYQSFSQTTPSFSHTAPTCVPVETTPTPSPSQVTAQTSALPFAGNISFWGDFESDTIVGPGNHNWRNVQAAAPGRINLINDSRGTYARVEVRDGDGGCSTCSERSELVMMQDASSNPIYENLNSGTQQYAFSVKFDPSWQTMVGDNNGAWGIFLQLHGPDDLATNPAFAMDASDRITFGMRTGDITQSRGGDYELSNGDLNKGHWIDFILTVKYAADNTGFVNLQRRDEGQTDFTQVLNLVDIPTLQYSSEVNYGAVGDHYMKTGLYRNNEAFTSVLYLDGFTRSAP